MYDISKETPVKKTLVSKMKIRFHDCDPFNHLNNSRYLDYMMTARTDQLEENYGFDIYKLAKQQGISWVTAQTQIAYIFPAFLMEEVTIETRLLSYGERNLLFEALMWNHDRTNVKAVMWTKLAHFNLQTQKSHVHDEKILALFTQVVNPHPADTSFDERVKSLRQNLK